MSKKILVEIVLKNGEVAQKNIKNIGEEAKKAGEKVEGSLGGAMGMLDSVTGGAIGKMQGLTGGVKGLAGGFKTLRMAIISTGIGALVVALGSLVAYFTQSKRGSDQFAKIMGRLGGAFEVVKTLVVEFGEKVFEAFTSPKKAWDGFLDALENIWKWNKAIANYINSNLLLAFLKVKEGLIEAAIAGKEFFGLDTKELEKDLIEVQEKIIGVKDEIEKNKDIIVEPFEKAAEKVKELIDDMVDAGDKGEQLADAFTRIADAQRELDIRAAQTRTTIRKLNKDAEDTRLSEEKRIAAAKEAGELERSLLEERRSLAQQEIWALQEKIALGQTTNEDLDLLRDKKVALAQLEMESYELQTTLQNKLNIIEASAATRRQKEIDDQIAKTKELSDLRLELFGTEEEQEIAATKEKFRKLREVEAEEGILTMEERAEIHEQEKAALKEIDDKYRQLEADAEQEAQDKKDKAAQEEKDRRIQQAEEVAAATQNVLGALEAFTDQSNKRGFERAKKINIAQTVMTTLMGVVNALSAQSVIPEPFGQILKGINAAAIAATGAAQIQKIKQTTFSSSSTPSTAPRISGGSASIPTGGAGSIPTLSTGGDQVEGGIRAYVVSKDVDDASSQNQQIEDQARLAG